MPHLIKSWVLFIIPNILLNESGYYKQDDLQIIQKYLRLYTHS